jgi:hypothetical protein
MFARVAQTAIVLLALVATIWYSAVSVRQQIEGVRSEVASLRADGGPLASLNSDNAALRAELEWGTPGGAPTGSSVSEIELRTFAELQARMAALGTQPSAADLAACLAEIDLWTMRPDDEKDATARKLELLSRLRNQVRVEVEDLQRTSLHAKTGAEAARLYATAGQTLALFPLSDEQVVLEEAKRLALQQVDIANRIDMLRRQRYNYWAAGQIGAAVDGYNNEKSYLSPKKENARLMESLVKCLGEIDPTLLEPAVTELYQYVLDLTGGSISEAERVQLAKRLTDPAVRRKTLGDF